MKQEREILNHSGFKPMIRKSKKNIILKSIKNVFNSISLSPKTDKQRFTKHVIQIGICVLVLTAVISLKAIDKPFAEKTLSGLSKVINAEVDIDEDLGRLKFVSDDYLSVFNENLSLPVDALSYQLLDDDDKSMMILGKKNEPVFATFSGEIQKSEGTENNDLVIIMHESGIKSVYSGVIPTVFESDSVSAGQAVGYLLGDYLTVNIIFNGEYLNPDDFIKDPVLR